MKEIIEIKQTMTSREIAELTGKMHKHVLDAIRTMEPAWVKTTGTNFRLSEYTDPTGRKLPQYKLSKTECLYVATKFNDEARAKLILRWEQLEIEARQQALRSRFDIPQTLSEALLLAANQTKKLEESERKLLEQKPKVLFAEAVETSKTSILISELAKILKQNGIDIGQNRLFEWMRQHGYLCQKGEYRNSPTQRAMDMGLFEIKKTTITAPNGVVLVTSTPKVTGKGQTYFVNKFLAEAEVA